MYMRLMIKIIFFLAFYPIASLEAQFLPGAFSGDWDLLDSKIRFRFENDKVLMLEKNDNGFYEMISRGRDFQFQQSSLVNRNNAQYTWINTCKECGWTETQTYLFSFVNKYVLRALKVRVVNNIGGVTNSYDSWHGGSPKSFTNSTTNDLQPAYLLKKNNPSVGAASSQALEIKEITQHEQFTSIRFMLQNTSSYPADFTLHPPGSNMAFRIQDMRGRVYNLIDEFGYGGFVRLTLQPNGSKEFLCYFQPIPLDVKTINIKEGDCSGELCWNFYEVSLK